jgi:methionine-rich copper-binding protein CopC
VKKVTRFSDVGAAATLLFTVFLFFIPAAARGHAYPDHADPKVGSTVSAAPAKVRIWFDSELEPAFSTIMVHNANNEMVDKGDGRVDPNDPTLLEVSLPPLPPGVYQVFWNVVARDTHRTMGNYVFTIK